MSESKYDDLERFFERKIEEKLVEEAKGVSTYSLNISLAEMDLYKEYLSRKLPVLLVKDDRLEHNVLKTLKGDISIERDKEM
jgi:hypothetical protein